MVTWWLVVQSVVVLVLACLNVRNARRVKALADRNVQIAERVREMAELNLQHAESNSEAADRQVGLLRQVQTLVDSRYAEALLGDAELERPDPPALHEPEDT